MKRLLLITICLLLVGCGDKKQEIVPEIDYNFNYNGKYYQVYTPYKAGAGENYFLTDSVNNYNVNAIEEGLLDLSSEHYNPSNYYYQEGQLFTRAELVDLLSKSKLNLTEDISVGGQLIKPNYISAIYEENFLDKEGKLEGVSIGIVVNCYQKVSGGYHTVNEEIVVNHAKEKAKDIISAIRTKDADVKILIGIYVESSPNSTSPGAYKYYGITSDDKINFESISQSSYYVTSNQARNIDLEVYNNYQIMESKLKEALPNLYISGLGYYQNSKLVKLEIRVTRSFYKYGELLYLTNVASENIIKYFGNVEVRVEFRENNDVKAYIIKSKGTQSTDIFIY
jgi:protein involved in sex pheromone biosynthesis